MPQFARVAAPLVAALALGACTIIPDPARPPETVIPAPTPTPGATPTPTGATAALMGVQPGPAIETLAISDLDARGALQAFNTSCRWVTSREDRTGLTRPDDWAGACEAAIDWTGSPRARRSAAAGSSTGPGAKRANSCANATPPPISTARRCNRPEPADRPLHIGAPFAIGARVPPRRTRA